MATRNWIMAGTAVLIALALGIGMYGAGRASTPAPAANAAERSAGGGISVAGHGSIKGTPDTAYINLGFTAEHASLAQAREDAASKMTAVLAQIEKLGVAKRDIQTANLNTWRDQERKLFVVSNEVRVTIRDVERASALLDGAMAAGANNVQGISFGIEDRAALERQARERAIADAKAKAGELARITGVTLGAPVAVSEGAVVSPPMPYARGAAEDAAGSAATPIEPGQLEVSIDVQVTYAIR